MINTSQTTFTKEQIIAAIHANFSNDQITDVQQISSGVSKHTYKIYQNNIPYIFQIWKSPEKHNPAAESVESKFIYSGGLSNALKA